MGLLSDTLWAASRGLTTGSITIVRDYADRVKVADTFIFLPLQTGSGFEIKEEREKDEKIKHGYNSQGW